MFGAQICEKNSSSDANLDLFVSLTIQAVTGTARVGIVADDTQPPQGSSNPTPAVALNSDFTKNLRLCVASSISMRNFTGTN